MRSTRRPSRAVTVGVAGAVLGAAGAFASCGEATQVVIDVRTNTCALEPTTEIVLGRTLTEVQSAGKVVASKRGCDDEGDGIVGSLTVLPREGSEDGFVAIRVTAALGVTPAECAARPDKCIVTRGVTRFAVGRVVRMGVFLDDKCVGVSCEEGENCVEGRCVPIDAPPSPQLDSGSGAGDANAPDATVVVDAGSDASDPLCAACAALASPGVTARCELRAPTLDAGAGVPSTACVITVDGLRLGKTLTCPPGLPCFVTCTQEGACNLVTCGAGVPSCEVSCAPKPDESGQPVCAVACSSPRCRLRCEAGARCSLTSMGSADAFFDCSPSGGESCSTVVCTAPGQFTQNCKQRMSNNCKAAPCVCTEGTNDCNDVGGGGG
jgi:hypothetical protein